MNGGTIERAILELANQFQGRGMLNRYRVRVRVRIGVALGVGACLLPVSSSHLLRVSAASGADVVAVRGTDSAVWTNHGSGWAPLGGQTFFTPATLAANAAPLYVVTGTDANLWVRSDTAPWQPLTTQHTMCSGSPGIASDPSGTTFMVACKGGDGALWYATGALRGGALPAVGGWSPLGGRLLDGPALATVEGQATFMVNGTDGWLYTRTLSSQFVRTNWRCVGSPGLAGGGTQAYFGCHGTDGSLWHSENAGGGWGPTRSAGGRLAGDMLTIAPVGGGASEYVEGLDHGVYRSSVGPQGTSTPFQGFGGLVAREGPLSFPGSVPVLMYHYIRVAPPNDPLGFALSVTPADFAAQMDLLARDGFHPVSMHDALLGVQRREALSAHPIVITFDDGYADFATTAVPILQQHGFTATDFVVSGFLTRSSQFMTAAQVQSVAVQGMTVGDHTVTHANLPSLSSSDALFQLQASRAALRQLTGQAVSDFAYPYGAVDGRTAALVQQAGFEDGLTTSPGVVTAGPSPFTLPRVRVSGGESLGAFASSLGQR
ncbi:MAG: hypothetical protein NVSMB29_02520 [Candidatus Dormibacteria bacterium]